MSLEGLPRGFLWGVATAAQQIEGSPQADGRGESVWDRYARQPGRIADGSDPFTACDHYRRWREDVGLLRWLGVGAYRMSLAWPRLVPDGRGAANPAGLDHYDRLVDALLEAGIVPFVTLNHWDLPQPLQDAGGWSERATVDAFVRYADLASRRLGDRVRHWVTHNEPWCVAHLGWEVGEHAPGLRDPAASLRVAHHLLLSHGRAVPVLRANAPGAKVGLVDIATVVQPATDSDADRDAARELDGSFNRWYLDPPFRGAYPADAVADRVRLGHLAGPELPFVEPGDLRAIAAPTDFLGLNYYSRIVVRRGEDGRPAAVPQGDPAARTDMGWEVYPDGLREVLVRAHRDYAPRELFVTENGAAFPDAPPPAGPAADPRRTAYLREHVEALASAAAAGVPVAGYFVWSLMDNFEWGQGLARRFGLFHVDYPTQRRTPRESAHWYRETIAGAAAVPPAPLHP